MAKTKSEPPAALRPAADYPPLKAEEAKLAALREQRADVHREVGRLKAESDPAAVARGLTGLPAAEHAGAIEAAGDAAYALSVQEKRLALVDETIAAQERAVAQARADAARAVMAAALPEHRRRFVALVDALKTTLAAHGAYKAFEEEVRRAAGGVDIGPPLRKFDLDPAFVNRLRYILTEHVGRLYGDYLDG